MKYNLYFSIAILAVIAMAVPAAAQPEPGWQAELTFYFHDVSGTVTVVDEDTLQVDDFNYDGGGLSVYFYLATADNHAAYVDGLQIGPQLKGTSYDGTQGPIMIDLPMGELTSDWNAISVWCVTASANFGSGTFEYVPSMIYSGGDYNGDGIVDGADYTVWRDTEGYTGASLAADGTGPGGTPDGVVDSLDYDLWVDNFGNVVPEGSGSGTAIPEPSSMVLLLSGIELLAYCDRRRS